jgi:sulfite reductase alpha subunit-like flavoprotein
LHALSEHCNLNHCNGKDQRDKLISLSETAGASLYADYIIRNKRNWVDLFYDFDSLFFDDSIDDEVNLDKKTLYTLSSLISLLPSIAPRHFSIASAPSYIKMNSQSALGFELELCVAVVEGTTSLGRTYSGCCSSYLASIDPCGECLTASGSGSDLRNDIRLWITPGSFHKLPINQSTITAHSTVSFFETPILCVGAGTGIAPLRSLIFEREAIRLLNENMQQNEVQSLRIEKDSFLKDNTLVFGCRKRLMDYYYGMEWELLVVSDRLRLVSAFSRDQQEKLYVQRALREMDQGSFIAQHILQQNGAVYIAGGSKMARAVKDEIVTALGAVLEGGESDAKKLLNRMKRNGLFSIEAWS